MPTRRPPRRRHIAALLKQWDITETPQRRIAPKSAISGGAELIANGEVDIGLYLLSEVLTVQEAGGGRGMLPPALQNYIVYAGAVLADSPAPEAAAEFIRFVADPSRLPQWKTTGSENVSQAIGPGLRPRTRPIAFAVAMSPHPHESRHAIC